MIARQRHEDGEVVVEQLLRGQVPRSRSTCSLDALSRSATSGTRRHSCVALPPNLKRLLPQAQFSPLDVIQWVFRKGSRSRWSSATRSRRAKVWTLRRAHSWSRAFDMISAMFEFTPIRARRHLPGRSMLVPTLMVEISILE